MSKIECSACGAEAEAGCECGVAYVPAIERAKAAIEMNPEMSDRAIAADIRVGKDTVRRARKGTGAPAPVPRRIGRDGKARKLPAAAARPRPEEDEAAIAALLHLSKVVREQDGCVVGRRLESDAWDGLGEALFEVERFIRELKMVRPSTVSMKADRYIKAPTR